MKFRGVKKLMILSSTAAMNKLHACILNIEPFCLENALNLTHEFFYDNFIKKFLLNFLVKIVIKKLMCQF